MKSVICTVALIASASAFAPQVNTVKTTALEATSRREAMAAAGAAAAAFLPLAANAATGESPRFSVFGLIGDGTSYSEGAAYGSDQKGKTYSPYSVYGEQSDDSLYKPTNADYKQRKVAVIAETKKRLTLLPRYVERKEWWNVKTELTRYMYDTRGAVRGLATTNAQKEAATAFFEAIEKTNLSATLKKQDACMAAAKDAAVKLDEFAALI